MTRTRGVRARPRFRILVCDDAEMVRRAVQLALTASDEFHLVDEAHSGHDLIIKALQLRPELVVIDVHMGDMDGAEATRQVLLQAPEVKILAYSSDSAWKTVDRMFAAGACGYAVKSPDPEEIIRAVRIVLAGGHYLSPSLLQPANEETSSG